MINQRPWSKESHDKNESRSVKKMKMKQNTQTNNSKPWPTIFSQRRLPPVRFTTSCRRHGADLPPVRFATRCRQKKKAMPQWEWTNPVQTPSHERRTMVESDLNLPPAPDPTQNDQPETLVKGKSLHKNESGSVKKNENEAKHTDK